MFLRVSASKLRFGPHLGPTLGSEKSAWDLKSQGIHMEKPHFLKNPRFELKSLLGPGLGTLLDLFWEGIWPPSHWKSVSKEPWGRPRADPNYFFGRQMQKWMLTWRVLERSRTLSGGQGAPRCLWAAIWDVFRLHVDLIWTLKPPPGTSFGR